MGQGEGWGEQIGQMCEGVSVCESAGAWLCTLGDALEVVGADCTPPGRPW